MYRHNVVISCGTVALMVLGQFSDIYGPIKKKTKKTKDLKSYGSAANIVIRNSDISFSQYRKYLFTPKSRRVVCDCKPTIHLHTC